MLRCQRSILRHSKGSVEVLHPLFRARLKSLQACELACELLCALACHLAAICI